MIGTVPTEERFNNRMRLLAFVLLALVAAALAATAAAQGGWRLGALGVGTVIVLGSFAVGAMLGFLFAVPRVFAAEPVSAAGWSTEAPGEGRPMLRTNANLERISDWLTTMLVGVGLSQLTNINDGLLRFRRTVQDHVPCMPAGGCTLPLLAPLLLLFGLVAGFLFMYLYTRVELIGRFVDAERRSLSTAVSKQIKEVAREVRDAGGRSFVAAQVASEDRPMSEAEAISLMFSLLYQPKQHERVIRIGQALSNTGASKRADYWFYLAAAFGQRMIAVEEGPARQSAGAEALYAARQAVKIDPSYRARLWSISDPGSSDNDLSLLRENPDFRSLTGKA